MPSNYKSVCRPAAQLSWPLHGSLRLLKHAAPRWVFGWHGILAATARCSQTWFTPHLPYLQGSAHSDEQSFIDTLSEVCAVEHACPLAREDWLSMAFGR